MRVDSLIMAALILILPKAGGAKASCPGASATFEVLGMQKTASGAT